MEEIHGTQLAEEKEEKHFHVLAVDDSLLDRKLLERLLKISSYQVTCVESVDKALEYLGLNAIDNDDTKILSQPPSSSLSSFSSPSSSPLSSQQKGVKVNLIMTDYCMPGMSGYDLLKRVKGSSWKDVPVVVMSSENVPSRVSMCLEEGAEEFLQKPLQLSDLKKLQPFLLKSLQHSCKSIDKGLDDSNNSTVKSDEEGGEDQSIQSNSSCTKRKALSPEPQDKRPKMKELLVP